MTSEFYSTIEVADGQYQGKWGGYKITFEYGNKEVTVDTEIGVRGMNVPCTFRVVDGKLVQESVRTLSYAK